MSTDATSVRVTDNPAESRYEIAVDGEVGGILTYATVDGVLDLQHTIVLPSHRGQGLAAALVQAALDDLRAKGTPTKVSCSYAVGWVAEHPDYADFAG